MISGKNVLSILFTILISVSQTLSQTGHFTYTLHRESNPSQVQSDAYKRIKTAMDSAIGYYNKYTSLAKDLNIYYDTSVQTADADFDGTIRFGSDSSYMVTCTAMHEMAHTVGVGTTTEYKNLIQNGRFTGPQAISILHQITGKANDTLYGDTLHFWPYGLNYSSEVKGTNDLINHCKIVNAIYQDLFHEKFYGMYRIQSKVDGRYIVPSGTNSLTLTSKSDSTSIVGIIALFGGVNTFRLEFGSKVLDIPNQSTQVGIAADLWSWNNGSNQKAVFEFQHPDTTTVRIKMLNSGLYLRASGDNIVQDNASVSPQSQFWKLIAPDSSRQTSISHNSVINLHEDSIQLKNNLFFIKSQHSGDWSVTDLRGRIIRRGKLDGDFILPVMNFPTGFYFLNVRHTGYISKKYFTVRHD